MKKQIIKPNNLTVKEKLPDVQTNINKEIIKSKDRITKLIYKNRIDTNIKETKSFIVKGKTT